MARNSGSAQAQAYKGRVIIQLPRSWYGGKQKIFSLLLPESPENLAYGVQIAAQINSDYALKQFDHTLAKYKPKSLESQPEIPQFIPIAELWRQYCDYKAPQWKVKTKHYYLVSLGRHIHAMPQDWRQPLTVRAWLLQSTSTGVAVRVLNSLQTVFSWAIRCRLVSEQRNPFERMGKDMGTTKRPAAANAFTTDEQERVINAFYSSQTWHYYGHFVEFLFLTGCRPSEAVGLNWEQIAPDFSSIKFDRSMVRIAGKVHTNKLSKTNRARVFPCGERLQALLAEVKGDAPGRGLVFKCESGDSLSYENLQGNIWGDFVGGIIGRKSTPYSCRDTFITRQIALGKPPAVIAKWVDNSISMIEKKYLDIAAINDIKPG